MGSQTSVYINAAASGDTATVVKMLDKRGVDVDARHTEGKGARGETALYAAAVHGHSDVIDELLKRNANVNAVMRGQDATTALLAAVEHNHDAVVDRLLAGGADHSICGQDERSPLHFAVQNATITEALLAAGADPNVRDAHGSPPLYYAALKGADEVVAVLLSYGAKVNARGRKGRTALHAACKNSHSTVAISLAGAGAELDAQDADGESPLDVIDRELKDDLSAQLREAAASAPDVDGAGVYAEPSAPPETPAGKGPDFDAGGSDSSGSVDDDEENECKVCFDSKIDCVILDCGHVAVCFECGSMLDICPICRAPIARLVKTYHA